MDESSNDLKISEEVETMGSVHILYNADGVGGGGFRFCYIVLYMVGGGFDFCYITLLKFSIYAIFNF